MDVPFEAGYIMPCPVQAIKIKGQGLHQFGESEKPGEWSSMDPISWFQLRKNSPNDYLAVLGGKKRAISKSITITQGMWCGTFRITGVYVGAFWRHPTGC